MLKRAAAHLVLLLLAATVAADAPRILILGDSIAYDGRWTTRVESALRNTPAYAHAEIINLALPSETVNGLSEPGHARGMFPRPCLHDRLPSILRRTQPTIIVACYGMNDGLFQPLSPETFAAYKRGMERLVAAGKASGARVIVLTPPLHGADNTKTTPRDYDIVLDTFAGWLTSKELEGWEVVDIRPRLRALIARERGANPRFRFSQDNVHPDDRGHELLADVVLEALWVRLKLPEAPQPGSVARQKILGEAQRQLKLAWLSEIGHKRPGIPKGLPLEEASKKALLLRQDASAL
ncbi:MAG: GDSL-type esterase/lipase family protein [Opitutia bacterium]|jgi:lysophospholipase L1-like esterase